LATLLVDPQLAKDDVEESKKVHVFSDVNAISEHLDHMIKWAEKDPRTAFLNIGVFGIGTGAAAALIAAARNQNAVMAVVAQSGHLGPAAQSLRHITAPTLLVCGSLEKRKLDSNRKAISVLNDRSAIKIIEGTSNLLEDPASLEEATSVTAFWFEDSLE
jgi:putative phosphoribosyl transferase